MKWKLFFQIIMLIILSAIAFYLVYPKYYVKMPEGFRYNKITGKAEKWFASGWGLFARGRIDWNKKDG